MTDAAARASSSTYLSWQAAQGIPVLSGQYIQDLRGVPLGDWSRVGGRGAFINHDASDSSNDCHLIDIPPAGQLAQEHHLYEEMVYVLAGTGATRIWSAVGTSQTFEWQAGSLFALPLNAPHQHFNTSGANPARLLCVTNAPTVMNLFRSSEFVYGCPWEFTERYNGQPDYFRGDGYRNGRQLRINVIADVNRIELSPYANRGTGGEVVELSLAGNTMGAHISQFPVGTYKKAHRHGPGAHLIVLSGTGYTLMWPEGEESKRYDWSEGSLVIPPDRWFHQHFNSGREPARYLALRYKADRPTSASGVMLSHLSTRLGGDQIDYTDESPVVARLFAESLARSGVENAMVGVTD